MKQTVNIKNSTQVRSPPFLPVFCCFGASAILTDTLQCDHPPLYADSWLYQPVLKTSCLYCPFVAILLTLQGRYVCWSRVCSQGSSCCKIAWQEEWTNLVVVTFSSEFQNSWAITKLPPCIQSYQYQNVSNQSVKLDCFHELEPGNTANVSISITNVPSSTAPAKTRAIWPECYWHWPTEHT